VSQIYICDGFIGHKQFRYSCNFFHFRYMAYPYLPVIVSCFTNVTIFTSSLAWFLPPSFPSLFLCCSMLLRNLGYEAVRSPMSSRGVAQLWGFLDLSWPWESRGRIYKRSSVVSWLTSTRQIGGALVTPKDRPVN